jgi:phosphonate transport system ATP-binding protein
MTEVAVITTEGLTKRYPDGTLALRDVDLEVAAGEAVVLLGSNGSGKSTLLRCLTRLLEPTSGTVHLGGVEVTAADRDTLRAVRRRVGVVFQHINLVDHISVLSNVVQGHLGHDGRVRQWFAPTATAEVREEAMACLERVRVADLASRRADQLSGGQRQRVALARMLMQRPEVVLADEPVAALDPRAGREVMDLLWNIVEQDGLTLVCTLHQLELARAYGRRLVGLRDGRQLIDGDLAALDDQELAALYDLDEATDEPRPLRARPDGAALEEEQAS